MKDWQNPNAFSLRVLAWSDVRCRTKLFEHKDLNLRFIGFLDDNIEKRRKEPNLILGSLTDARAIVEKHQIDSLVIALPLRAYDHTNRLVADLLDLPVKVWIIPDYFSIALHQAVVEDFAGIPMLDLRAPALNEYQRMLKRGFDLIVTVLVACSRFADYDLDRASESF